MRIYGYADESLLSEYPHHPNKIRNPHHIMKLSLCIATYNEEANIHYPLDSAYDFVDEVIIVDGGSADKTVEKAKSYGKKVKVFIEPNPPMFHLNKQKAIERAKGEWILQLNANE